MAVFQYPKGLHRRRFEPFAYRKYRSFKRVLQHEFVRVCVYCRTPDSISPGEYYSFAVDHYRPKVIPRFRSMETEYENLYYCCGPCNSRKGAYWPLDEVRGPYILNPCEHDMAAHLRLKASTFEYESKSPHGAHMIKLLQLNDPDVVEYRRRVVGTVELAGLRIAQLKAKLAEAKKKLRTGKISQAAFDVVALMVEEKTDVARRILQSHDATAPMRELPKTAKLK